MRLKILSAKFSKIYFCLIITAFFFGLFYIFFNFFIIKEIVIKSENKNINGLSQLEDKNILLFSENNIKKSLSLSNPLIDDVQITKKYPNQIIIDFYPAVRLVCLKTSGGYFILSETAKIIEKTRNECPNLEIMTYYQKFDFLSSQAGQSLDLKDIKTSLFLLKKIKDKGVVVNSIDINAFDMLVFNLKDKKVYFSAQKDSNDQVYKFETIYNQFIKEGRPFKSIDLRFDKPVIKL